MPASSPTTLRSVLVGLLVICLSLSFVPPAEAAGSFTSNVGAGIAGETLTFAGSVPPNKSRPVELQRRSGIKWIKVASGKTSSTGSFKFSTTIRSATTTYRVYARAVTIGTKKYGAVATATRKITTQTQKGTLAAPSSAKQGAALTFTSSFTPVRPGRPVALQTRVGRNWVKVATGKEGSKGTTRFTVQADTVGSFSYRAVATSYRGAAAISAPAKKVTITAAPGSVPGRVTVSPGDQSAAVSWSAVLGASGYRVYRSLSADGGWTLVAGSPVRATTLTVVRLTNATQYWFRVAAVGAKGVEGPFSLPVSAVPDVHPLDPSVAKLISPNQSTKVSAGVFTATIPAGSVSNTGMAVTVTPLSEDADGLPGVDVHIHGVWDPSAGGVTVSGPFPANSGAKSVVFHEHDGHMQLFTGSHVAVNGATAAVTLDTLSSTYFGATICDDGPLSILCTGSKYNGWDEYVQAMKAKAIKELYRESQCGDQRVTTSRTARTWGETPFGIACSTSPNAGAATWKFQNVNHSDVGLASTGVVYVHDEHGGKFTIGRVADPDAAGIKTVLAAALGTRVIVPGDSLTITKSPNSGETTSHVRGNLIATTMWHGVGDILALLNGLVPVDTEETIINGCAVKLLYDKPTNDPAVAKLALGCIKDAVTEKVKEELASTPDTDKNKAVLNELKTANKALFWLNVATYAFDWALAFPTLDNHPQTLRNYDQVLPPTNRGGNDYIARDPSSGRAVWVSNGAAYAIPDGGAYLCLAKSRLVWDIGGLKYLDTPPKGWPASGCQTAPRALWDYKPSALGGNTGVDVMLRNPAGNAWLVNTRGELQNIPDGGTYLCLAAANPVIWNVPAADISAWKPIGPSATCGSEASPTDIVVDTPPTAPEGSSIAAHPTTPCPAGTQWVTGGIVSDVTPDPVMANVSTPDADGKWSLANVGFTILLGVYSSSGAPRGFGEPNLRLRVQCKSGSPNYSVLKTYADVPLHLGPPLAHHQTVTRAADGSVTFAAGGDPCPNPATHMGFSLVLYDSTGTQLRNYQQFNWPLGSGGSWSINVRSGTYPTAVSYSLYWGCSYYAGPNNTWDTNVYAFPVQDKQPVVSG